MKEYPVIKIALSFIIGIIIQKFFQPGLSLLIFLLLFLLGALLLFYLLGNKRFKSIIGFISLFCFIFTGAAVYSVNSGRLKQYPFPKLKYQGAVIKGKVKSIDLIKEGRLVFNASIHSVKLETGDYSLSTEFIVRIYDNDFSALRKLYDTLSIGDEFTLTGTLQKPRDIRNPGEFDYNNYLYYNGINGIAAVYGVKEISFSKPDQMNLSGSFNNFFHRLRKGIDDEVQRLHNPKTSALLRGLLLGDYKKIDEESIENYINAGVVHVLAVSGQHVALIMLIFFFLFNRFNPYLKYILAAAGLIFFLFITGGQVSVERAVIMGLIFITAVLLNRDRNVYNILALSALVILIISPNELFNPGFQLSFAAVISIACIFPLIKEWAYNKFRERKKLRLIILFGAVSVAAQIGTLPFTLAYFHKLSIASLGANLIVIPLSGFIIYLGIITLFAALFTYWGASVFAAANSFLGSIISIAVDFFGERGRSFLPVNQFSIYDALIYYAALILVIYTLKNFRHAKAKLGVLSFIAVSLFLFMSLDDYSIAAKNKLTVIGADVGQGDATIIKFPQGHSALIDAGNAFNNFSCGDKIIIPLMDRLGINSFDYAFITHLDADHYYGLIKMVEKGKISTVFKPAPDSLDRNELKFERYLMAHGCLIRYFSKEILSVDGCRLYFFNHPKLIAGLKPTSNNKSMIMKLVYGNNSFLFTGDADKQAEAVLVSKAGGFLKSDILKAGHHGSKNSSSDEFLGAVTPRRVFISCGILNRFNHPSPEVIEKLAKLHIPVERTDLTGGVIFSSDGNKISLIDWKKRESQFIFGL